MKKGILKNVTKFTGKHLCQSLFFNKVAGLFLDPSLVPKTQKINVRQVYCRYLDTMTWSITIFCSDFLRYFEKYKNAWFLHVYNYCFLDISRT